MTALLRHQQRALLRVGWTMRTLPYWPGRRVLPGFGNSPATRMAPVLTSTWRSAKSNLPLSRIDRPVRQNQLQLAAAAASRPACPAVGVAAVKVQIFLLADGEIDLDRIERRHRGDDAARRAHQRTHLLLRDSRDAVDGRREPRESEVDLRGFDRGLGRLHGGVGGSDLRLGGFHLRRRRLHLRLRGRVVLGGVVQILLGDGLLLRERRVAVHIELRAALIRFRHRDLRFGLGQLRARLAQLPLRLRKLPCAWSSAA